MELSSCHGKSSTEFTQSTLSCRVIRQLCECIANQHSRKIYNRMIELLTEKTNPGKKLWDFKKAILNADFLEKCSREEMILANTPPTSVKASFELFSEKINDVIERKPFKESVAENMEGLAVSFRNTYIETPIANEPSCHIEKWDQYEAAGEGVDRRTNKIDSCYYGFPT